MLQCIRLYMFALYFYVEHNCVFQVETKWKDLTEKFRDPLNYFSALAMLTHLLSTLQKITLITSTRRRHILQTSRQKLAEATTRGNLQPYSLLSVAKESIPSETI